MSSWEKNEEIQIFREYLRIPSVHPDVDYEPCVEFLRKQAESLGLPVNVYYPFSKSKPIVVITWTGTQPNLSSIILNSHMDVVPVFPEKWIHQPFGAEMDEEGRIFARGAQDMKCVGTQYLAVIRALKKDGVTLKRTIHMTYVPDEEIGGHWGMEAFTKSEEFKKLNVGFSLDEGMTVPHETFPVFFAERSIWHLIMKISGPTGHGSLLLENTAGQKLQYVLNKIMELRAQQVQLLKSDSNLQLGDVTSVNLTLLKGGVQCNVIPAVLEAGFDIRLAIDIDHDEFEKQLRKWCDEAGGGIEFEFIQKEPKVPATKSDESNLYWLAFKKAMDDMGLKIQPQVFPGGTDSRFLREAGIPAIGFSPINNTPVLLHDHEEFLRADTYLKGVDIYKKVIPALANV